MEKSKKKPENYFLFVGKSALKDYGLVKAKKDQIYGLKVTKVGESGVGFNLYPIK